KLSAVLERSHPVTHTHASTRGRDALALVLNAGSSSLKFCVYRCLEDEDWRLDARGQVDGIASSPRLAVVDGAGRTLAAGPLDGGVQDGDGALEVLARWLGRHFAGSRVAGVGHRVVHGGPRHAAPCVVTGDVLYDLRALIPLAPLHQPHNLAAIEAVAERLP